MPIFCSGVFTYSCWFHRMIILQRQQPELTFQLLPKRKFFQKRRITVEHSGTGAAFLFKYMIRPSCPTPPWLHLNISWRSTILSKSQRNLLSKPQKLRAVFKHRLQTRCAKAQWCRLFCFGVFFVFACVKWNTEQHKCSSPHASPLAAITWEAGTRKKSPFSDERKESESISGEIGWHVGRD